MTVADFLDRLDGVRRTGNGWIARCPAHADRSPSLSVKEGDRGLLVKCWAGCTLEEVTEILGIRITDLFFETPSPRGRRPTPTRPKIDRVSLAFRFELAALDRRLRAERVLMATRGFDGATLSDDLRDRLMAAVASAYRDIKQADVFEHVADTLRERAFHERTRAHAA